MVDLCADYRPDISSSRPSINMNKSDSPESRRLGSVSGKNGSTFLPGNAISSASVASPAASGPASFGLGSGAFASFGSAGKAPRTPSGAFDWGKTSSGDRKEGGQALEKEDKRGRRTPARKSLSSLCASTVEADSGTHARDSTGSWPLRHAWVIHYRPPTSKNSDYEKSTRPLCRIDNAQAFWTVYSHLKRPSALPTVSDYHFFKEGIRPVWEDEENKRGGKWTMRLKKGVADRYWEELLLALIGDQFAEAAEEVCGAVVSVRSGEDVFSIWTKNDGGRNVKIRETVKRVLNLPSDTQVQWRSHDESITQRNAVDQARSDKQAGYGDKRRNTVNSGPQSYGAQKDELP